MFWLGFASATLLAVGVVWLRYHWKPWDSPKQMQGGTPGGDTLSDRFRNPQKSGPRTTGRAGQ